MAREPAQRARSRWRRHRGWESPGERAEAPRSPARACFARSNKASTLGCTGHRTAYNSVEALWWSARGGSIEPLPELQRGAKGQRVIIGSQEPLVRFERRRMPLRADPGPRRDLVLVLAPTGRDAETVITALNAAGITAALCPDVGALCRGIEAGAGAALIAEEALSPIAIGALDATLANQAPWSDLPLVLVTGAGEHHEARVRTVKHLVSAGNVRSRSAPSRRSRWSPRSSRRSAPAAGSTRCAELTAALVRAEQEHAQAEALQRSESLYRALARNYPNGAVLVVDRNLRCTLAEGRGLATLGLSRGRRRGRPLSALLPARDRRPRRARARSLRVHRTDEHGRCRTRAASTSSTTCRSTTRAAWSSW